MRQTPWADLVVVGLVLLASGVASATFAACDDGGGGDGDSDVDVDADGDSSGDADADADADRDGEADADGDRDGDEAPEERCFRHLRLEGPNAGRQQTASLVVDVDGDGDSDFLVTERTESPSVVLYRHDGGSWTRYVVDDSRLRIEAGGAAADIDGDGDLDVSFAGDSGSNQIWWWENPAPDFDPGVPWTRRTIKDGGENKHHDQMFGDFDGDGALELVFWNQRASGLFLAEIPPDPRTAGPWPSTEIYSYEGGEHEGLAQIDVDGDGVVDIVGGGRWFEHSGGTEFVEHVVDDGQRFGRAAAGQLVPGGYAELVFGPGDSTGPLRWYSWSGEAWEAHDLLDHDVDHGHSLQVVDVDADGALDVFTAEMRLDGGNPDAAMWLFLGDGAGGFDAFLVATGYGNHESRIADLDGDGHLDILGKPYNWETPRIDLWLSCAGEAGRLSLDGWRRHVVDEARPDRAIFVAASDLDGDGLSDIATGAWWYRNPGSVTGAWERAAFGDPLRNLAALFDFDSDGDVDVLGTRGAGSAASSELSWAENDGAGGFVVHDNVDGAEGDFLQGVCVADLAGSPEVEVALSWHQADRGVQMLSVPADPASASWAWSRISETSQDEQLSCGDIDADGDADVLLGTLWLEADAGAFAVHTLFDGGGSPDRSRLADVDGDGRLDAVVGYEAISVPGTLAWYGRAGSATDPWAEHVISTEVVGPMSLDVGDLDADGDVDVVVGEHDLDAPASARLLVFENADGAGTDWIQHLVSVGDEHHDGAQLADLDADGDLDIVSIGWGHARVLAYENLAR